MPSAGEPESKRALYLKLVAARKACHACPGLANPADPSFAEFDTDDIGPWAHLHGDLNAELMVVGQDWGDTAYFRANQGADAPKNPTNKTLEQLLDKIGYRVCLSEPSRHAQGLFLTNAILCLKEGGLQAKVRSKWFSNCGTLFLRRQIEIVSPRVVVTLGERARQAVLSAFRIPAGPLRDAVADRTGIALPNGSTLVAVYHCGRRVLNTKRTYAQQVRDWERVAESLERG